MTRSVDEFNPFLKRDVKQNEIIVPKNMLAILWAPTSENIVVHLLSVIFNHPYSILT